MGQPPTPETQASVPRAGTSAPSSVPGEILRHLREAHAGGRTGRLHLTHDSEHRGLDVRDGQVVRGRSDVAGEHLGDVLVRHGLLTEAQRGTAVATVLAEKRPLGAVLLSAALLDRERLEEAIGWHAREILHAALDRATGSSAFEEVFGLPGEGGDDELVSRLPTGQLLLEAARRIQDPAVVRGALGDLDRKLALPTDPRLRGQRLGLTPTDGFVLSRIDGTLGARELAGLGPLPPEEIERSLLALLCAGVVVPAADRPAVRRSTPRPVSPPPPPSPAPPSPPPPPPERTAPVPPPAAVLEAPKAPDAGATPSRGPEETRRLILEAYSSLVQRDHFEILGVTPDASPAEVQTAYARLARSLHPDACRDPLLAEVEVQREAVFLRVCRAYEILRDPEARAGYERDVRQRRPRPAPRAGPAVTFWSSIPTPPAQPKAPPPPPSPPSSAAAEPPPPPPPSPARRADARPHGAAGSPPPAHRPSLEERLAETIARGEELLQEGQTWEAMQQLEPTLMHARGALRIRARLALARACLRNPKWGKRAEAHLQDVLQEDPLRVEAYLLLGDLYRDGRLPARAVAMYRRVLELQPLHRVARRQLALLEAEQPGKPDGGGGLLGFLKKR